MTTSESKTRKAGPLRYLLGVVAGVIVVLCAAPVCEARVGWGYPPPPPPPPVEHSVDGVTVRACWAGANQTRFQVESTTDTHGNAGVGVDAQFFNYFVHANTLMFDTTVETQTRWLWVTVQAEGNPRFGEVHWPNPDGRWLLVVNPCSAVDW